MTVTQPTKIQQGQPTIIMGADKDWITYEFPSMIEIPDNLNTSINDKENEEIGKEKDKNVSDREKDRVSEEDNNNNEEQDNNDKEKDDDKVLKGQLGRFDDFEEDIKLQYIIQQQQQKEEKSKINTVEIETQTDITQLQTIHEARQIYIIHEDLQTQQQIDTIQEEVEIQSTETIVQKDDKLQEKEELDKQSTKDSSIEEKQSKIHRKRGRPKANDRQPKVILEREERTKIRAAKRVTTYKECNSDIDEEQAEIEGKLKTEMTKVIKLRQKINREKRQKLSQSPTSFSGIPHDPVPGTSGMARDMRPTFSESLGIKIGRAKEGSGDVRN